MSDIALSGTYWRFWSASTAANVADGIREAAFPLLAAALTQDPRAVAAVVAAQSLPWLLVGLAAGSVADRMAPARVVAVADIVRVGVLTVLLIGLVRGWATVWVLVAAAFAIGAAEAFRDTAAPVVTTQLVPTALLERANGRLVSGQIVGNEFVGPPIGAWLFGLAVAVPLAVDGGALALAAVLVLSLPATLVTRRGHADAKDSPVRIRAGLRWVRRHRVMRSAVVCSALLIAADAAWWSVLVLFSFRQLGLPAAGFGALLAAGAVGGLLGAGVVERLARVICRQHLLALGALAASAPAAGLAVTHRVAVAGALLAVSSAGFAIWNVLVLSQRQRLVPAELLGRVTAVHRTAVLGLAPVGALAGGWLATVDITAPFWVAAVVGVGIAVWMGVFSVDEA